MFKKIAIGAAFIAITSVVMAAAFGVPKYSSVSGTRVISSTPVNVDRLTITSSTGSAVLSVYNATSVTGAVAGNLVASVTVTAATGNLQINMSASFTKGLVISTAGNANTVTAWATVQPLI